MRKKQSTPDAEERRSLFRAALMATAEHMEEQSQELPKPSDEEPLRPEDLEPLSCYGILTNEEEKLLLVLPGYFRGEPEDAMLFYNGGDHAIFSRNIHQFALCDEINPQIRELLFQSESILVYEEDSGCRYIARVMHEEIDELAEQALLLHAYHFPHHPYPVLDGTFRTDGARCDCCNQETRIYYRGITRKHLPKTICPFCIDAMAPAREGDSLFPDPEIPDLLCDTPPYLDHGQPGSLWAMHCGEPGVYLGRLDPLNFGQELRDALRETWDHEQNLFREEDPQDLFKEFLEGDLTAHLFRCAKCRKLLAIFYERTDDCGYDIALSALYRRIQETYGDSFTETWFQLSSGEDGSASITEMVGDRGYHTVRIDREGNILSDGGFDLVREWKEDRLRVHMDWENVI